jgi:glutamyl-tRNA synthetase
MKKNKKSQVRTRIPPSPTGYMHIGTARTALFNFLFARHNGGEFLFRIEDTDTERSKPEFTEDIIESMRWLGLWWDGEILKQSERKEIYAKYIKQLLDSGKAFWCYHTKEDLEKEKKEQADRGEAQVHFCSHKNEPEFKIQNSKFKIPGVIRLKCDVGKEIGFNDLIRGEIKFSPAQIGDIVIAKDEENPLYNFAVVVDDYESEITHVIRGEDHISNTPKQIMILEALGLPIPKYAHMALTLAPDKTKLSKRHGAVSINEYREMGYLPEALVNFMALLGWNPGTDKEIFLMEELIKEFSIERMQKSSAVFNIDKLDWFNSYYIRQKDISELTELCIPYLEKANLIKKISNFEFRISNLEEDINIRWLQKAVELARERMRKLSEIGESSKLFFREPEYDIELLRWKKMTNGEIKEALDKAYNLLSGIKDEEYNKEKLEAVLMPEAKAMGDRGRLLWPLRASVSGLKASPGPFEIMGVLGKERALRRIKRAIKLI